MLYVTEYRISKCNCNINSHTGAEFCTTGKLNCYKFKLGCYNFRILHVILIITTKNKLSNKGIKTFH